MINADLFKDTFGTYATEIWSMPEKDFLKWLNEDAKPKTGHWIEIAQYSDGKHKIECSECGNHIFDRGHANSFNVNNKYKYCPNCGAKMFDQEGEGAE